jgi:aminopeptidase 2
MLSTFLGEDVFLSGVKRYLARHKFGNASTDNLWAALEEESHNDVSRFMSIWTKKTGVSINGIKVYLSSLKHDSIHLLF